MYRDVVPREKTFLELPFDEMVEHACADANVTLQLHTFLEIELRDRKIDKPFEAERTMAAGTCAAEAGKGWHTCGRQSTGAASLPTYG